MVAAQSQHVFVSYVRDDDQRVDELCRILDASQIPYWRDRKSLAPGDAWKTKIREAIQNGALVFLACFSDNSRARGKSTMNEELSLAVEEFRKMPPGRTWLIPVRFDDGEIPAWELGPNKLLSDLNYVDLFGSSYAPQAGALVTTINKLIGETRPNPANALAAAEEAGASERRLILRSLTKEMLPDPTRRIQLDDLISQEVRHIVQAMDDETRFPRHGAGNTENEATATLVDAAQRYWNLVEPFCYSLQVAARWGDGTQLGPWVSGLRAIVAKCTNMQDGEVVLSEIRRVAATTTIMVAALACAASERWDNFRLLLADQRLADRYSRDSDLPLLDSTSFWEPFKNAELAANILNRVKSGQSSVDDALAYYNSIRGGRYRSPFADWTFATIRPIFEEQILDDESFEREFDLAEVFLGIVDQDLETQQYQGHRNAEFLARSRWFGRATWRTQQGLSQPLATIRQRLERQDSEWLPLQAGLFGGDVARAAEALARYEADFNKVARSRG